ncbi:S8 family serine peptidase, partial [Candidatus Omnitrophota bacterium]
MKSTSLLKYASFLVFLAAIFLCTCGALYAQEGVGEPAAGDPNASFIPYPSQYVQGEKSDAFTYEKLRRLQWLRRSHADMMATTQSIPVFTGNIDLEVIATPLDHEDVLTEELTSALVHTAMMPTDPYYSSTDLFTHGDMWAWDRIDMQQAWDISTGAGVIVAVLDTGIDYTHPDIASQLWYNQGEIPDNGIDDDANGYIDDYLGWDFVGTDSDSPVQDKDVMDVGGHGTHVAGIIAAGANTEGIIGVAPDAKILPVRVLDNLGVGPMSAIIKGIDYAVAMGAKVINLSLGGLGYATSALMKAVKDAIDAGSVIIAAAGNEGADVDGYYPANIPGIISVSATAPGAWHPAAADGSHPMASSIDPNDPLASFSNYGDSINLAAPGVDILSLRASGTDMNESGGSTFTPDAEYMYAQGTSMAAPFVSGLAALLFANDPTLTPDEIKQKLYSSAEDLGDAGFDPLYGHGLINAYQALQYDSHGADEYDMFEYYPINIGNTFAWKDGADGSDAGGSTLVADTRLINGTETRIKRFPDDDNEEEYLTQDSEGIKIHGYKLWDPDLDPPDFYDIIFDTPLLLTPRHVEVGGVYSNTVDFTYLGVYPSTYSMETTIDEIVDLTLPDGTVVKNVMKATHTTTMIIRDEVTGEPIYTSNRKNYSWYMQNFGSIKEEVFENVGDTVPLVTEVIKSGITYYPGGNVHTEFLESIDGDGFIYYERKNEDFDGQGRGRIMKAVNPDAGYTLFFEYWGATDVVRTKEIYDTSGKLTSVYNYNSDGSEMDHIEFYASGRMHKYIKDGTTQVFKDEDFYGTIVEQGRIERYDEADGSYITYTYFGDTDRLSRYERYDDPTGETVTRDFYDEDYFRDLFVLTDSADNTIRKARIWNDADNGWDTFFIKRNPDGDFLSVVPYNENYDDNAECFALDSSDNLIFVTKTSGGSFNIRKYDTDGAPVWNETFNYDGIDDVSMNSMVVDADGNSIITGKSLSGGIWSSFTVKVDSDGGHLWASPVNIPGSTGNAGYEVSVNSEGNIEVLALADMVSGEDLHRVVFDSSTGGILANNWYYGHRPYSVWSNETGAPTARESRPVGVVGERLLSGYHEDKYIVTHEALSGTQDGWLFWFYDGDLNAPTGAVVEFDDNAIIEKGQFDFVIEYGHVKEKQIEKAEYKNGDTAWFLWGADRIHVGGGVYYSNVVLERTASGTWNMYSDFTQSSDDLDDVIDKANWNIVYSNLTEESVLGLLPEDLGDWWTWCDDKGIVPEFPPSSSDYTMDGEGRVIERVDHNPYLDTTYTYDWNIDAGQVTVSMAYDRDGDGTVETIYTKKYQNGTDYDIANVDSWVLASAQPTTFLVFDGVDDHVNVGTDPSMDFGTEDFTITVWMKTPVTDNGEYVIYSGKGGGIPILIEMFQQKIIFRVGSVIYTHSAVVTDGNWHHISAVMDRDTGMTVYVDGVGESFAVPETTDIQLGGNVYLGRYFDPFFYWEGDLADVRTYDRVLTSGEATNLYNGTDVTTGLMTSWAMDEGVGNTIYDSTGNNNPGSIIGGTAWEGSVPGSPPKRSLNFDGTDDFINFGSDPSMDFGAGDFTITSWIKTPATDSGEYVIYSVNGGGVPIIVEMFQQKIMFRVGAVMYTHSAAVTDGSWHHISAVMDRDTGITLYVDGQGESFAAPEISNIQLTGSVHVGRYFDPFFYWDGEIADVRTYNRVVTSGEATNLYRGTDVTSGLMTSWTMDEGVGGTVYDDINNNNNGTVSGNASWVPSPPTTSLLFDGIDDHVNAGSDTGMDFGTDDFTITSWIKTSVSDNGEYVIYAANGGGFPILVEMFQQKIMFRVGAAIYTHSAVVTDGNWHHISAVMDRDTGITIYVDGIGESLSAPETSNIQLTSDVFIGRYFDPFFYWEGEIADVRTYDRVLTSSEATNLYGGADVSAGLMSDWTMDEGTGNTVHDDTGTSDGVINGDTSWIGGVPASPPTASLNLDGVDDYVSFGSDASLDFGVNDFTITSWIKTPVTDNGEYVIFAANGGGFPILVEMFQQKIMFR